MHRPSDSYRHKSSADAFEERAFKTSDVVGMQSEHEPFTSELLNLQLKYGKSQLNNPNHDSGDIPGYTMSLLSESNRNHLHSNNRNVNTDSMTLGSNMMNKNSTSYFKRSAFDINNKNSNSTDTLTPAGAIITNGSKHWKNLSKRMSMHATRPSCMTQEESDSNDTDPLNSERNPSGIHYKVSPRTDSASKASSHSFNEELYNESTMSSAFSVLSKKSSTMLLDSSKKSNQTKNMNETHCRRTPSNSSWPQESDINFIMLVGLLFGLLVSKVLQYLLSYFGWFQGQVLHIRNIFLGQNGSIWDFCNFEDSSRYGPRTKLLLLPVVGACTLLYGLSSVLHTAIRCLLIQAPSSIIVFIQRLYLDV